MIEAFVTPSPLPTWVRIGIGVIAPAAIPRELAAGDLEVLDAEPALQPLSFTACWSDTPGSAVPDAVTRLEPGHQATLATCWC